MSRAIDAFGDEATREEVRAKLLEYFGTDTIWYCDLSTGLLLSSPRKRNAALSQWLLLSARYVRTYGVLYRFSLS